jgi:hypothetical protein
MDPCLRLAFAASQPATYTLARHAANALDRQEAITRSGIRKNSGAIGILANSATTTALCQRNDQ